MTLLSIKDSTSSSFKNLFDLLRNSPSFKEEESSDRLKSIFQFQYYYCLPLLKTASLGLALQFKDISIVSKALSFKTLAEYTQLFEHYYYLESNTASTSAYQLANLIQQLSEYKD